MFTKHNTIYKMIQQQFLINNAETMKNVHQRLHGKFKQNLLNLI